MTLSSVTRFRSAIVACGLWLAVAVPTFAGFSATLSSADKAAVGLDGLAENEWAALDDLVAEDVAFARRENLKEFDSTFIARLSAADRKQAGLDRLTGEQLARLNELVAAAIAKRPTPKQRPRLKESDVLAKRRGEIHGSVSVVYGWGARGRDYRAGSLWLDYYDPESRVGVGVGITASEGGLGYYYPGYYGAPYPGYYRDAFLPGYNDYDYYRAPAAFYGGFNRADLRGGGLVMNDSSCFRALPAGGFGGRGGRRR